MDVDRAGLHRPVRREQAFHQVLQAVGLLDDDLGVFAQSGVVELVFKKLGRAADASERILDFVRQIADQFAVGQLLLEQSFLARGLDLLVDRPEFDEQAHVGRVRRGDRAVQMENGVVVAPDFDVLPAMAPAVGQRVVDGFQQGRRAAGHAVQPLTGGGFAADGQKVLRGRVHVANGQCLVEQDHRRREQIEAVERGARGGRPARVGRRGRAAFSAAWRVPSGWRRYSVHAALPCS